MITTESLKKLLAKLKEMPPEELIELLNKTPLSQEAINSYAFLERTILKENTMERSKEISDKFNELYAYRMAGKVPPNCKEEYIKVLKLVEEYRHNYKCTDEFADYMALSNEYSKFFSKEECLDIYAESKV